MLKYFTLLFLIPIIVVGLSMTVILYYNPVITQSGVYGIGGSIIYSASAVAPDNRAVFIYIIDNINGIINNYKGLSTEIYTYYLKIENKILVNRFRNFEKIEIIVFGANTPVPHYIGSIDWIVASSIISFIENNKFREIPQGASAEINIQDIKTNYVYTAVIVYVKKNTVLSGLTTHFKTSRYAFMLVTDAIKEELKGNYTVATILSDYRRFLIYELFETQHVPFVSVVSKITFSEIIIVRWLIAFTIILIPLLYDYRRNPENYEFINKILRKLKRTRM
ncbi:MAG: hypothetical protein J7L82_00175 [Staphylothermus sp.]|nr:hypothetical protein [Staphylothermus sp.]